MSKPDRKPKYPMVLVEWEDAGADATAGWMGIDEARTVDGFPASTAGFMIRSDKTHISIVQGVALDGHKVTNMTIIPRGCVKRIRKLKV